MYVISTSFLYPCQQLKWLLKVWTVQVSVQLILFTHALFNSTYVSIHECSHRAFCFIPIDACQTTVTVTVLSFPLSLVLTLSVSTCAVSAVGVAVMYKRLQKCRVELRGGELCSTPQLSQSLLWNRAAASLMQGEGTVSKQVQKGGAINNSSSSSTDLICCISLLKFHYTCHACTIIVTICITCCH